MDHKGCLVLEMARQMNSLPDKILTPLVLPRLPVPKMSTMRVWLEIETGLLGVEEYDTRGSAMDLSTATIMDIVCICG